MDTGKQRPALASDQRGPDLLTDPRASTANDIQI
jgi:hypothetical protein